MHCGALTDFLLLDELLPDEARAAREAVAQFVDREFLPRVDRHYEAGTFPTELIPMMGELGLFGATLDGYGCPGASPLTYGAMMMELERGDSGLRSMASVQGMLAMWPIFTFGTEEQKQKWLPALREGKAIGCFGLTEPDFGSNPGGMRTRARKTDSGYVLSGEKTWITNGSLADVAIVWAKLEGAGEGPAAIRGFLVEKGTKGFEATDIHGKLSMRCSVTSSLHLDDCEVPETAILPGAEGLRAPLKTLNQARFGIAFGVVGAAIDCFARARDYAEERTQFGKPIGAFQLVQQKLVDMHTRVTHCQHLMMRLGKLKAEGRLSPMMVSFAKRDCVDTALFCARSARDIMGANGITLDYGVMRHLCNLETVRTYEGTHDIHTLALGRYITGQDAFGAES